MQKKPYYLLFFILTCFLFQPVLLFSRPQINIIRTDTAPVIDGLLSEDVWNLAEPITKFVQREPDNGEPASQDTEVFILYDERYLYIGIRCYDDPEKIIRREMARDASLFHKEDRVLIFLDTHLDGRNAYWFEIGPNGAKGDAIVSDNGMGFNRSWQGIWEGKTSIQDYGWEVEIAIPFNTLNFDKRQTTWGLKLIRDIQRRRENSYWPSANINNSPYQVSDAGILTGLENISQGVGFDINPYAIAGHNYNPVSNGSYKADAGADVFYQLTSSMRGILTLNTDFAETEIDARQINLSRFGLHFPEKRDFFLDGVNYFDYGISGEVNNPHSKSLIPFFSRRLGLDAGAQPLPIYAGGRITGQMGDWNVGFLNIFQEKVYDNNNFTALRVNKNIGSRSSAGMIATLGNAVGAGNNALYGLDTKIATSNFAGNKNLVFIAYGLQSITDKPDIEWTVDHAFGTQLSYPNDLLFGTAGFLQIDQDFTAGIGFIPRKGIRNFYFSGGVGPRPGRLGILQIKTMGGINQISDLHGNLQTREIELTPFEIMLRTGELFTLSTVFSHENLLNDFNLLDRMIIPAGKYDFRINNLSVTSATQKNLRGVLNYEWGEFFKGSKRTFNINIGWHVFAHLYLGAELENSYVNFPDGGFNVGVYMLTMKIFINTNINLTTFIQYDDVTETTGMQSRFQWIIKPGRELLMAWNSNILDPMERFDVLDNSVRLKLKYNIRF